MKLFFIVVGEIGQDMLNQDVQMLLNLTMPMAD